MYVPWQRINQMLDELSPINPNDASHILRNRYGLNNNDIGICNEKSLNQSIAHHSVVFQPEKLRIWVSSSPWQLGEYICYDLNKIFNKNICFCFFAFIYNDTIFYDYTLHHRILSI